MARYWADSDPVTGPSDKVGQDKLIKKNKEALRFNIGLFFSFNPFSLLPFPMPSATDMTPANGLAIDHTAIAGTEKCLPTVTPGETFWQTEKDELHDHRSTEQLPEHSDIVIIGAGYAGVGTAYHLMKDYDAKSVTILEARGACSGATGRNGGHCRPDLYGHIPTYIDRAGAEAGAEVAQFEIANLRALKKIIEAEKIDCDFTLTRSTDVWCNEESAKKAKAVYDRMVAENLDYMDDVVFYTGARSEGVGYTIYSSGPENTLDSSLTYTRSPVSRVQRRVQALQQVQCGLINLSCTWSD